MAFSIRTKLTFWYVTLLTASLLAFGAVFSYTLSRIFIDRVDEQIGSVAGMMAHTVVQPSGKLLLPGDFDIILERFFGIRIAGNFVQVLDMDGNVAARSSNLESAYLPLSQDTYEHALNGVTTFEVYRNFGRYPVRLVTKPISLKHKGVVAIVQVGASLQSMEEVLSSLFYIFGFGLAGSVIIAAAGGWVLARKALKPVQDLRAAAQRIGAENLNERINVVVKNDEIGRLAATMNEMIARLEKSFLQIKQFTADASHELKTPLTILKGEMEIALRIKNDPEAMRDALKSSLEEIDRMSYIVRNLLDLARIDVEKTGMKDAASMQEVALDRALTERVDHFRRFALDRGVNMAILRNDPVAVFGDPVRISQMLFNLIDNALKYTPQGGTVELSVEAEDNAAVIKVRDTGIGISKEDLPYIFDRFYRVDKARSREALGEGMAAGGAGLGLSICREIAESLKGAIEAQSEPGMGTTFIVRLPLA
ncbi:MAG: HAMP domain-containing protein [Deltaproteobacteria bacterium]|nr:HAMP domain-containing protein [Deltaproteobacteria bacterium]